jgi:nucleoid DNA-binding protein
MPDKETTPYEKIVDYISKNTTLTPTDVGAVLLSLRDAIVTFLPFNKRIHLDKLGYFYLKLKFRDKKSFTDGSDIKSSDITIDNVEFLPETSLINDIKSQNICFENYNILQSGDIDKENLTEKLNGYFKNNNTITVKDFQIEFNTTRYMATLILKDLSEGENPMLKTRTIGRLTLYAPQTHSF